MAQKILSMDIGRVFQYVDTLKIDLKVRVRPPLTAPPMHFLPWLHRVFLQAESRCKSSGICVCRVENAVKTENRPLSYEDILGSDHC